MKELDEKINIVEIAKTGGYDNQGHDRRLNTTRYKKSSWNTRVDVLKRTKRTNKKENLSYIKKDERKLWQKV